MTDKKQNNINPRIARTRARVLEATLELAADSGLQACTFDAVSERSGVARSTLYRHWSSQAELVMEAIESQEVERVAPDTGNLRDDMFTAMLELGRGLEHSLWGAMVPQLVAAAYIDPEMSDIQRKNAEYHQAIDVEIIERAITRGEIPVDTDSAHAALLFVAPIFYRKVIARQPIDAQWIAAHVDKTVSLLRQQ